MNGWLTFNLAVLLDKVAKPAWIYWKGVPSLLRATIRSACLSLPNHNSITVGKFHRNPFSVPGL